MKKVALPESEGVLALQFTGGISDQEGAVWSVSQLFVHFLSANTVRLFGTIIISTKKILEKMASGGKKSNPNHEAPTLKPNLPMTHVLQRPTWRFLPNTTQHQSAGCLCRSWLTAPLLAWLALLGELNRQITITYSGGAAALGALIGRYLAE